MDARQPIRNQFRGTVDTVVQAGVINGDVVVTGEPAVVPHELPTGPVHFVERDTELAALDELLAIRADGLPAIAVVTGTAGVGKTALALRWAHRHTAGFPGGQLFLDLHGFDRQPPLTSAEAAARLLRSLGVARPEEIPSATERAARLRTVLSDRRVLLVLDNARSAEQVLPLLPGPSPSAVMVTSRAALGGLRLHHDVPAVRLAPLDAAAGTRLLTALAGERVTGESELAGVVTTLCAGLPLVLRIVAERLVSRPGLSAAALVRQLGAERTRISSLSGHVDVRAIFSWSYRCLGPHAAAVFRTVGTAPRGTFALDAAAAASDLDLATADAALDELVQAHLLTEVSPGRFSAHDLLRAYATELAAAQPEERGAVARRIFEHYLHTAASADLVLTPHRTRVQLVGQPPLREPFADKDSAQAWLHAEEPNLIALCRFDNDALDVHRWQLAYVLRTHFYLTKQLDGWLDTHEQALQAAMRLRDLWAEAATRNNLGMVLTASGRWEEALTHYAEAGELFARLGDEYGRCKAVANTASVLRRQGRVSEALDLQKEALSYYRRAGVLSYVGITLRGMAGAYLQLGEAWQAVRCAQEAVDIATWLAYDLDIAQASTTLGAGYRIAGEPIKAEVALSQALAAAHRCGSRFEQARALRDLGELAAMAGRWKETATHWRKALALYRELGNPVAVAVANDLDRVQ
ncbi:ATP-binding protein [Saccharothrix australiensis]|uniref:Putative ATPase n=1 Tax=Saccharothrix australiensis TaxID=2072 RepID=A0A495W1L9_9PSEU|nr:ATP-binding protein [Saccharothrix australiensis]RKT55526.1 putative ATPase [Saccharothrix australiensis]